MSDEYITGRTSQEAVQMVGNQFDLVLIASARLREIKAGHRSKVVSTHGPTVQVLEEIEQGKIGREYLKKVRGK
jgi:DNA-directed RNA polymerase omega subunit